MAELATPKPIPSASSSPAADGVVADLLGAQGPQAHPQERPAERSRHGDADAGQYLGRTRGRRPDDGLAGRRRQDLCGALRSAARDDRAAGRGPHAQAERLDAARAQRVRSVRSGWVTASAGVVIASADKPLKVRQPEAAPGPAAVARSSGHLSWVARSVA